jgi:Domain of unknown function (DUF4160)
MSEISRFFGIVIAMYHREHEPAHFHARYSGQKITVRINDGYVDGKFRRGLWHLSSSGGGSTVMNSQRIGG